MDNIAENQDLMALLEQYNELKMEFGEKFKRRNSLRSRII